MELHQFLQISPHHAQIGTMGTFVLAFRDVADWLGSGTGGEWSDDANTCASHHSSFQVHVWDGGPGCLPNSSDGATSEQWQEVESDDGPIVDPRFGGSPVAVAIAVGIYKTQDSIQA
jgi:hypothetical protein